MNSSKVKVPAKGEKISLQQGKLVVPDNPIIPFIEGMVLVLILLQ